MKYFVDCLIPFRTCNLQCHYCYITHTKSWGQKLPEFRYSAEHIGRAFAVKRFGGVCLVNICGEGETLLPGEIVGIIHGILNNGHYVMVVTNGTLTKRFEEIAKLPADCLDRLLFKFSFHYLELKRKGWLGLFFENVQRVKKAGCSFSIELTPSDEMIPYIDDAITLCKTQVGAACHVTVARDEKQPSRPILTQYSRTDYAAIWDKFQSELFKFKMQVFGEKRREYCYAGSWTATLDLVTGELHQCYLGNRLQNIFENIENPIRFDPIGCHCLEPHCYNAHAFMALGVIPSIKTPRYAEMRNRICDDGSEWLTPNMKAFLNTKLGDNNRELSWIEKQYLEARRALKTSRMIRKAHSLLTHKRN